VKLILERKPDTLFVPETAIVPIKQEKFVFRITDNKASLVKIRIGDRRGTEVAVLEGLSAGDLVVTDGQIRLRDGAAVRILNSPSPAQS
jgi:membrane fusion protein (multidrug efflux system)